MAAIFLVAPSVGAAQHQVRSNEGEQHQAARGSHDTYQIGHRPTTFRRMDVEAYRYPQGHSYRNWTVGSILPSLFLSNSYYFDNYAAMGLGAPPPGYVWVRYGPDLLLVDRRSGSVADVISNAFY
jgi:Ni/Co efflux regulator RcnB